MIRRFNYTGRLRINQNAVRINLIQDNAASPRFNAELDLSPLNLPPTARIYLEAYRQSLYERFSWGTVARPSPQGPTVLTRVESLDRIYFRVKIVDESVGQGLILAQADRISVDAPSTEPIGLLPVKLVDLGEQVWRVEFEPEEPWLYLNCRIDGVKERAQSDPAFAALVFPQILREVLGYIARYSLQPDDEAQWVADWQSFTESLSGETRPTEDDQMMQWIESAVSSFADTHRFSRVYQEAAGASS